jgi:TIR domain-containing protein
VYQRAARYCVLFASKEYAEKVWTSHERKSAQARAIAEKKEYILPVRFDATEIPGVRKTISYIDLSDVSPEHLARLISQKLGPRVRKKYLPPYPDQLFDALAVDDEDHEAEVTARAGTVIQCLDRTTEQERSLLYDIFLNGCPRKLPDNVHINLDLLRRISGMSPSESVDILKGLASLDFETEVRSEPDEGDIVAISWFDRTIYRRDFGEELFKDNNATELIFGMLQVVTDIECGQCATDALEHLDFSALSSVTVQEDKHSGEMTSSGRQPGQSL